VSRDLEADRSVDGSRSELEELAGFLAALLPFNELGEEALWEALRALRVSYHRRGARLECTAAAAGLHIVRSGAVDLRDADSRLLDRLGEGESFNLDGINTPKDAGVCALVIEDALIYRLPDEAYARLRRSNRAFDRYFHTQCSRRLRRAARADESPAAMLAAVRSVMARNPLSVEGHASIAETAQAMARRRVSSALIRADTGELLGIVTDRDLRNRVLAEGRSATAPVREVMSAAPQTIDADDSLFSATLRMTEAGFHHLPVVEKGSLVGMLTTSDLILARRDDPVYLVQHIAREKSIAGIRDLVGGMAELMTQWVSAGMRARQVSRVLTAISDAVTRRLIELAENELGPAPAPWAWLAFGSQARAEQLLGSDQDNGIVIEDGVAATDLEWYRALAERVCEDLATCGYRRCPGGIMASTEQWRQPLLQWRETVAAWARSPTPDAVMRVSIFFDIRAVYGATDLADRLQKEMLGQVRRSSIFQAALASGALDTRPPLGIFRRFVVDRDGEHRKRLDIKRRGVLPITDIVRLHALARGLDEVNTDARLEALGAGRHLALADARNLSDALHCIQRVRIEHQCDRVMRGEDVDNFIDPGRLPRLDREQLRDAFTIIDEAQSGLRQTFRAGLG
jgi:CBS domain-containing protein